MALISIPNIQTGDDYRDRALLDLINAEREMRLLAENGAAQMRKLLHTLAFRLAGSSMEDIRKTNPGAPDNWKAEEWSRFFNQHVIAVAAPNSGWNDSVSLLSIQTEIQTLRDQVETEKGRASQLIQDLQSRDAEIANRDQTIAGLQHAVAQYRADLLQSQALLEQLQSEGSDDSASHDGDLMTETVAGTNQLIQPATTTTQSSEQGITLLVSQHPVQGAKGKTQVLPKPEENRSKYAGPAFVEEARFQQMVQALTNWQTPRCPERYRSRLEVDGASETKARRHSMILYLVAHNGLSTNLEIDRVIATAEKVRMRSNSVKAPLAELVKAGFLVQETLVLKEPFTTSLVCLRLSEDGKNLCRIWGWEPVEGDWERVIRLHQGDRPENRDHTMGILILAMHARFRGWSVEILPDVPGPTRPDLAVMKKGELYFVEFENSANGSKDQKWRNIAALHPYRKVGICTFAAEGRTRHANDCSLLRISGVAADLASLIFDPNTNKPLPIDEISSEHDLWQHRW